MSLGPAGEITAEHAELKGTPSEKTNNQKTMLQRGYEDA
jgi:hypothetical protein